MNLKTIFLVNIVGCFPAKIRNFFFNSILRTKSSDYRKKIYFDDISRCKLGNNILINYNTQFHVGYNNEAQIVIEDNVYIGPNTSINCISHQIGNSNKRAGKNEYKSIIIKEGTWIGTNVTILQGVTIGKGCIIGAGSLVTKDCEENCLYVGIPARRVKKLD